ncbi:MAG: leucine--tRNA ligase [Planctomycetales bacterium]|nr:leucine--tRNA ligase [Planctomycetales bacterium]
MPRYNPAEIEPKWQRYWETNRTFRTPTHPASEKLYVLDMFPYPSGAGLHVGHPEGYTATDIVCRYARMQGKSVLHPMGFDAFGLPAEEHAIKTNTPPRVSTEKNIAEFTRQLKMLGFSYDWERVLATTDVEYFRWTQWIFLVLFDTWYDTESQRGRPISELPIPDNIQNAGDQAIARYRDSKRLAYQDDALVNWCPALGTVLANEEVIDGKSERGAHPVQRIPLRQWMLRITSYAERLLNDLESLDWSPGIKKLQSEWIGRSTGAEVDFYLGDTIGFASWKAERSEAGFPSQADDQVLRVYTTRPDTLFGATYMVIAPEHAFVKRLTTKAQLQAVESYCEAASYKSDRERTEDDSQKKTGVFTGSYAINPVNGAPVPIWIADYVLASYGTGAIMAVPAHDQRDFDFAQQFDLPIVAVVDPGEAKDIDHDQVVAGARCYPGLGIAINSGEYCGLETNALKAAITRDLHAAGLAAGAVNYKLRDWLFSRQRFWGEPFPILHELDSNGKPTGAIRAVEPSDLPINLPELEDYKPHGRPEPPLGKSPDSWLYVEIDGKRYRRETNTMPQWAGSCWYYLRFIDPTNAEAFCDRDLERAWMPVDLYVGGAEHAVLHLLYSRFWHKVLYDRGYVSTCEPFQKLVNQGMILGEVEYTAFQVQGRWANLSELRKDEQLGWVCAASGQQACQVALQESAVKKKGDGFVLAADETIKVDSRAYKMSKSRGNVVNPDEVVREYGADSLRLYEMFMGPLEATKPWSMSGVSGVRNFLDRVWRLFVDFQAEEVHLLPAIQDVAPTLEQDQMLHRTIAAVTHDLNQMSFNTVIARLMEFVNFFNKQDVRPRSAMSDFVLLLSPLAPHLSEELWALLGHDQSLAYEPWPTFDEALTKSSKVEIPLQVNGKIRSKITVASNCSKEELEKLAKSDERIVELTADKQIMKTIVVPGRLVNFVIK